MTLENPEAEGQIYLVAPAEGQCPLSIINNNNFEAISHPDKFPYGIASKFSLDRLLKKKLTYRKYFNQRLLDVDGRFAQDIDYLFVAQYVVEGKHIIDDGNNFICRQKPGMR